MSLSQIAHELRDATADLKASNDAADLNKPFTAIWIDSDGVHSVAMLARSSFECIQRLFDGVLKTTPQALIVRAAQ